MTYDTPVQAGHQAKGMPCLKGRGIFAVMPGHCTTHGQLSIDPR